MHLDKKIQATTAMEDKLAPRTADGKKVPMLYHDQPAPELLYPHFNSGRGMVFADEFADGKVPEDLEYCPGHEKPGMKFNGANFDAVVYSNPVLNLPYHMQRLLQAAQITPTPVVMLPQVEDFHELDEDELVVSTTTGLLLHLPKSTVKLTNFGLWVTERRIVMKDGQEDFTELQLDISCRGNQHTLTIRTTEIDTLVKVIQQKYPECMVLANKLQAPTHISNYVRAELAKCPTKTIYSTPGFTKIGCRWIYVHDKAAAPVGWDVMFRCGKSIGCIAGMDAGTALQQVLGILSLSQKLELMLPLLLLMHLGPLFNLFRAADCIPRFLTFLSGTTGSLKTALTLCLFQLFAGRASKPPANFYDTAAALEQKLGNAHSQVLLVDDFCPAVTADNRKEKLARLETVIRLVGDNISKSRSTPNQRLAKEFSPVGCCIVTGESTGGSRSTLLRCLVLPITRGDLDCTLLSKYQQNPQLLQTHFFHFLNWVGSNGDAVVQYLIDHFPEERAAFAPCVREYRLADTGAVLMLTAYLVLQYAMDIGVLSEEQTAATSVLWRNGLIQAIRISEDSTRELDPLAMYLTALMDLRNAGKLPLASCQDAYVANEHIGFMAGDCWWLRPTDVFQCITKYWKNLDRIFPLQDNDVRKLLAQQNLIEVEHGTRNGEPRVTYTKKASVGDRPRMLVLRADMANAYLERELNGE